MPSAIVITAIKVNPGDLRSWRRANVKSFISLGAQSLDGINIRSASRRDQAGNDSHQNQYNRRCEKQRWVVWRNLVELRPQQPAEHKCSGNAAGESYYYRHHTLAKNELQDIGSLRTERDAYTNFTCALSNAVSDRAVNTDGRQKQRNSGKQAQQNHH